MDKTDTELLQRPAQQPDGLPAEVRLLFPREQEIAAIIYRSGPMTAREVQSRLSDRLAISALNSMLGRLVRKAILDRIPGRRCHLYAPALTDARVRERALRRFAEDFCEGSLAVLVREIRALLRCAPSLDDLLASHDRQLPKSVKQLPPRMREVATFVYRAGISDISEIQRALSPRADGVLRPDCVDPPRAPWPDQEAAERSPLGACLSSHARDTRCSAPRAQAIDR